MNIALQIIFVLIVAALVAGGIIMIKKKPLSRRGGDMGNAIQSVQEMFEPGTINTTEIKQEKSLQRSNRDI